MKTRRILSIIVLVAWTMSICMTVLAQTITNEEKVQEETTILEEPAILEETIILEEELTNEAKIAETEIIETEPVETESEYIEKFPEVPLYNQLDYGKTAYGDSTVKKSGCGITCYAMVLSYLLDKEILPDELAAKYHRYKGKWGSSHLLFTNTQEEWGVTVEKHSWGTAWIEGKVMKALENGQPIIANVHADSVFTEGGHFIVLYGLTEDGKILVRDPNGANYESKVPILVDGFANGFEPKYFRKLSASYFIYQAKDIDAISAQATTELEENP